MLVGIIPVLDQRVLYYHVHITPIITAIMVVQLELNVIVRGCIDIYMYMYIAIDSTNCSHGDIKLTGGKSSNEGDVQICVNGTWGYVCSWPWYTIGGV